MNLNWEPDFYYIYTNDFFNKNIIYVIDTWSLFEQIEGNPPPPPSTIVQTEKEETRHFTLLYDILYRAFERI